MGRRLLVALLVLAAAAGGGVLVRWWIAPAPPATVRPQGPGAAAPGPMPPASAPEPTVPPRPEPTVPVDLPTPAPGLDRALAGDYEKALRAGGLRISALIIVDDRARGGVRRADIVYKTATDGTLAVMRPEIVRILGPGVNPQLALDQVVVRPTRADGTVIATITVTVGDADRWLRAQLSDDEFYAGWTVRGP